MEEWKEEGKIGGDKELRKGKKSREEGGKKVIEMRRSSRIGDKEGEMQI